MLSPLSFTLPPDLAAREPPEIRGIPRDQVRLMVINRSPYSIVHTHFNELGKFLKAGDLLVFNKSRTLPASLRARESREGRILEVRLAEHLSDGSWLALLLTQGRKQVPLLNEDGLELEFGMGLMAHVYEQDERISRLWRIRFNMPHRQLMYVLHQLGRPIRYEHVPVPWGLEYYQNVYSTVPGSAEMPSAGRAFTWRVLFDLHRRGVKFAHIVLHTGLSSYMDDTFDKQHVLPEEEYIIAEEAAEMINKAQFEGGRVLAVGTTVVRALESASNKHGHVTPQHDYTRARIDPNHTPRVVDGLLTGLHEPEATHVDILSALLPRTRIWEAYSEAVKLGYLWHEFGDLNLIL